jgi:hypothetical protein
MRTVGTVGRTAVFETFNPGTNRNRRQYQLFVCEIDEGGKLAIKLQSELSILRDEPDLFNELTS